MKKNILLILLVIILSILPLLFQKGAAFGGSDDQAKATITKIDPSYQPWFSSILVPPSREIESLLFSVQAALGAGFIGYFIGFYRGKGKKISEKEGKGKHVTH